MNGLILVRESYPVGFAAMSGVFGAILGSFLVNERHRLLLQQYL